MPYSHSHRHSHRRLRCYARMMMSTTATLMASWIKSTLPPFISITIIPFYIVCSVYSMYMYIYKILQCYFAFMFFSSRPALLVVPRSHREHFGLHGRIKLVGIPTISKQSSFKMNFWQIFVINLKFVAYLKAFCEYKNKVYLKGIDNFPFSGI